MSAILQKEMRSLLRERRSWLVPTLYAAILAAAVYLFVFSMERKPPPAVLGTELAGLVAVLQGIAIAILGPLVGAASIASEREQGTWTRLIASPISRYKIATGKVAAAWFYVLLMLFVSLPIAALSILLGGPDAAVLAGLYATHALVGFAFVCIGLAASTLFHRTWPASLVAIAATLGLTIFTLAIWFATGGLRHDGTTGHFWLLYFNPGYSFVLFFGGDTDADSPLGWWAHWAAMASIAAVSFAFVVVRLRKLRE